MTTHTIHVDLVVEITYSSDGMGGVELQECHPEVWEWAEFWLQSEEGRAYALQCAQTDLRAMKMAL